MSSAASQQAVNDAYKSLFGRDADAAGLEGYATMLDNGQLTSANLKTTIASGATGTDKDALNSLTGVVAGTPYGNQINVADYAGQLVTNPGLGLVRDDPSTPDVNESMLLSDHVTPFTDEQVAAGQIGGVPKVTASTYTAATADTTKADQVAPKDAQGYDASHSLGQVAGQDMTGAHGTVNSNDLVDPNVVGSNTLSDETKEAMKPVTQNMSTIIDTSTIAGKALAQQLGEGNYLDSQATLKGQLDILQKEFTDGNGNPIIPSWASGAARNVQKIASFRGMTGTAATAALAQAIMEASLPVAQSDATFFQTLTLKNLDNRQQSAINNAQILSKLDMQNADARTTAAITNAQTFMQMDLANLTNDQQAKIVNTQSRIQAILADVNADNVAKQFGAASENEMTEFYDNLNSQIQQFNASQANGMAQFNANALNTAGQFNASQKQAADTFNAQMAYQVDAFNATWRQNVMMTENQEQFAAATTDVKNQVDISQEALNQIWNQADTLLDYAWKSSESEKDRNNQLALVALQGLIKDKQDDAEGLGNLIGTIVGGITDFAMGSLGF